MDKALRACCAHTSRAKQAATRGGAPTAVTTKASPAVGHVMAQDENPDAALCAPSALTVVSVCDVATTQPRAVQSGAPVLAVQVFAAHVWAAGDGGDL